MLWMVLIPFAALTLKPVRAACIAHPTVAIGAFPGWVVGTLVGSWMLANIDMPYLFAMLNPFYGASVFGEASRNFFKRFQG